tara:strand:+ start:106 stop:612 length:507 start_codon:yes stop_codon:yes gene_type:complete
MDLKQQIKKELEDKNEQDRLKRVEFNSKLQKSIIYVNDVDKNSTKMIDELSSEGIPFTLKKINDPKNKQEWLEVISTCNIVSLPTVFVNGEYLVFKRDFNNSNQLIRALGHLADPDFENPPIKNKIVEHMKTQHYNLNMRINQLEAKIKPLIDFIQNLKKELAEEDDN